MSAELKELVNSPFLWVITIGGVMSCLWISAAFYHSEY